MDGSCCTLVLALVVLLVASHTEASLSLHMDDFIKVVKQLEREASVSPPVAVLKKLRRTADLGDPFLRSSQANIVSGSNAEIRDYISRAVSYRVTNDAREEGVVLTPDGTTVALAPLLLGLEAGFRSRTPGHTPVLRQMTLARDLGLVLDSSSSASSRLGADGCWDNVTSPQVFTLSDSPYLLTAAQINGAMDGVVLGSKVSLQSGRPVKLSDLLLEYYCHQLDGRGMDAMPQLISRRRRENFRGLVSPNVLTGQVVKAVELQRRLTGHPKMQAEQKKKLREEVKERVEEFVHMFMECPPIVPRCMWGAKPYQGTPTMLSLPLSFLYIHHTYIPSQPCLTFQQCAENMRSMQRFHQEERRWDDIGYSFVAGSDGNIYAGRGWLWQGAHTKGHNDIGYGVSFIGNHTAQLPSQHSMELVRDRLASCAVGGGWLKANFTMQGHRQVVDTSCPGDALYEEIKSWEHFGEVKRRM